MSNKDDLQVGDPDTFIGEVEHMDLGELHDNMFGVAWSTGKRNKARFVCSTLRAPLNFFEMVEMVGHIYRTEQVHAKAMIISKDTTPKVLDECTIDFIEAHYEDIIMNGLLGGALDDAKQFTCKAGFVTDDELEATQQESST